MKIYYLKQLERYPRLPSVFPCEPLSEPQIVLLEQTYNGGSPFPKVLKELLYLAGGNCYVLDYGTDETQQDMQDFVRGELLEEGKSISRPFYAIDVYNAYDQFLFVYLDEGDNPAVHEAHYSDRVPFITDVAPSLSAHIDSQIELVKQGRNPF